MSNFYSEVQDRTAAKDHKCTWCAEHINKGDDYKFQKGNHEGSWFETKMHPECWQDFIDGGENEYTPYSADRPIVKVAK